MPRTALASACLTLLTSLCLHAPSQAQQGASALAPRVGELVGGMYGQLDTLYKDLHATPSWASRKCAPPPSWRPRCAPSASR